MALKIISFIRSLIEAILRDIMGAIMLFNTERILKKFDRTNIQYADVFRKFVRKNPNKPCIIFEDQTWTFQDVSILFLSQSLSNTITRFTFL